ncbi:MAG: 3-deoxy-manno-octulosonate cytidylyltransferase [Gammaproteobacteria bacterium AqS3]|nr:3-deoxy-manno-octulosonate cytidylyltransferase [Gammaproteobacteria bacterium AqS3]
MKRIAVIPARWASSRLPGKVLADIAGAPMIRRVWECARGSGVDRVLIAADDARVRDVCLGFGAEVVMTDADLPSGTDRIAQALDRTGCGADALVVNVQGDEPLLPPGHIDAVMRVLIESGAPMATLAEPLRDQAALGALASADVVKVVCDRAGRALYFSRAAIPHARDADAAPPAEALRHIGLYAYRFEYLRRFVALGEAELERTERLEQLRALAAGDAIAVGLVEPADTPGGVDTAEDLERVRAHWASASRGD